MNHKVMNEVDIALLKLDAKRDVLEEILRRHNQLEEPTIENFRKPKEMPSQDIDMAWRLGYDQGASDLLHIVYELLDLGNEELMKDFFNQP